MADVDEIVQTVEALDREFTDLVLQGLRAVGAKHLASLESLRQEFERIGVAHLAERIATLVAAIRNDDRSAASALLRGQTSLRVFERLLTVQTVRAALHAAVHADAVSKADDEDEDGAEEEDDE